MPDRGSLVGKATWENCRADFAFDGALINLLVPGTSDREWEDFWTALRAGPFELRAFRDSEPMPLPESVAWAMSEGVVASVMVSIQSGTVTANCHFFCDYPDLDLDPREITTEAAFESALTIMRFIATTTGREVFAVAEGSTPAFAFLRVPPDGQATFLQAGSVRHNEPLDAPDRPAMPVPESSWLTDAGRVWRGSCYRSERRSGLAEPRPDLRKLACRRFHRPSSSTHPVPGSGKMELPLLVLPL
jgi:hypothetical protein